MLEQPVRAQIGTDGQQVVEVTVRGGYRPTTILARAGLPLRIVFRREDDDRCTERVVFSAPKLERHLAPRAATAVDLPAQPPGEIRFTCGMGRYRGRVELTDEATPAVLARLRGRIAHGERAVGVALAIWIVSLSLVAVVAVLALDPSTAVVAAGGALVVMVAGCLWAVHGRPSTRAT